MADSDNAANVDGVLERIRAQARARNIYFTRHAEQEMFEETISTEEVLGSISVGQILENYPDHRRGSCCLLCGFARHSRPIHVVCTTARPVLIIITVYKPKPPKWITPTQRRNRDEV